MKRPAVTSPGDAFVKVTRDLVESDAWRSLGINGRRVIDFLMREHLRHGGQENGRLKAPQQQLETFGIGARYVADAIAQAETRGLVTCKRGGMRTATLYALAWLPTCDGQRANTRWREFREPNLKPAPVPKTRKSAPRREGRPAPQREGRSANLPHEGKADRPENLPLKGKYLSRSSYQGRVISNGLDEEDAAPTRMPGRGMA